MGEIAEPYTRQAAGGREKAASVGGLLGVWKKRLDLNQRTPDLQSGPFGQARARFWKLVDLTGIEPATSRLQGGCSPN